MLKLDTMCITLNVLSHFNLQNNSTTWILSSAVVVKSMDPWLFIYL